METMLAFVQYVEILPNFQRALAELTVARCCCKIVKYKTFWTFNLLPKFCTEYNFRKKKHILTVVYAKNKKVQIYAAFRKKNNVPAEISVSKPYTRIQRHKTHK